MFRDEPEIGADDTSSWRRCSVAARRWTLSAGATTTMTRGQSAVRVGVSAQAQFQAGGDRGRRRPGERSVYAVAMRATLLVLLSACQSSVPAPAVSRETPAARQFGAWLAAFNSGDRARLLAYHEASFPYEVARENLKDVDREVGLSHWTGGFELKKAEENAAIRFTALLKERAGDQFARASMEVDAADPHRVRRFDIRPIPTPAEFRLVRMTQAELVRALRREIDKAVAADRFSGAVLVARNGVPIFAQAYGLADREKETANTLDTRFRIGSMNKMFTAVATLQLVQAGKLALTDPLAKVLPDYPNKTLASKVTIHHLLTHTGGTGDIFGPEFDARRLELRTLQDYVKLYGARDLEFEPGARWVYSNYGFLLLGVVIEKVTGKSYYEAVEDLVFGKAGMTRTSSPIEDRGEPGRSIGYTREDPTAPWTSAADTLPYRGTSAGGGDSTVTDLLRFANALTSHTLLDAEHTALLTTGKADTAGGGKYAYGFSDETLDGTRCFGHGGGAPGMNGDLVICSSGYTIAVLSNLDPPAAGRIADFIKARMPLR
jgi:D-alanyl-D-alanine carboxypeptidase